MTKICKSLMIVVAVLMLSAVAANATVTWTATNSYYGNHIRLAQAPQQVTYQGNTVWEYVYDLGIGLGRGFGTQTEVYDAYLRVDTGDVKDFVGLRNGKVAETWSSCAAGYPSTYFDWGTWSEAVADADSHAQYRYVYYTPDQQVTNTWGSTLDNPWFYYSAAAGWGANYDAAYTAWAQANGTSNIWHAPNDYEPVPGSANGELESQGVLYDDTTYRPSAWGGGTVPTEDGIFFELRQSRYSAGGVGQAAQLYMTIRLLSKAGPTGTITLYSTDDWSGALGHQSETVVGPGVLSEEPPAGAIPEPSALALVGLGVLTLVRRRK